MFIKILRALLIGILLVVIGIPLTTYLILSLPWAQERLTSAAHSVLTDLLGTEVAIEKVEYQPFNRLSINGVSVSDDNDIVCLGIENVEVRFEVGELLTSRRLIIDYVVIDGLDALLYKDSIGAPLNIAGIISRFKKDEKEKKPARFDLRLNDLEIINSSFRYNVLDAPDAEEGRFDPKHIAVSGISIGIHAPKISDSKIAVQLSRLKALERSGLEITDMTADVSLSPSELNIKDLEIYSTQTFIGFGNISLPLRGYGDLAKIGTSIPLDVEVEHSMVYPPNLAPLLPLLGKVKEDIYFSASVSGTLSDLHLRALSFESDVANLDLDGSISGLLNPDSLTISNLRVGVSVYTERLLELLSGIGVDLPTKAVSAVSQLGTANISATYNGDLSHGAVNGDVDTDCGSISLDGTFAKHSTALSFNTDCAISDIDLGSLLGSAEVGKANAQLSAEGEIKAGKVSGTANADIQSIVYKGHEYANVHISAKAAEHLARVEVESADPDCDFSLIASSALDDGGPKKYALGLDLRRADPYALGLSDKHKGYALSAEISAKADVDSATRFAGFLDVKNLQYVDSLHNGLLMSNLNIDANCNGRLDRLSISSDYLNGTIEGHFDIPSLPNTFRQILATTLPQLYSAAEIAAASSARGNDFDFDFTIAKAENPCAFLNLPVTILDPVYISGHLNAPDRMLIVNLDADWLLQGNKLVEDSHISASVNGNDGTVQVYVTTFMPTKKGPMNLLAVINGNNGLLQTDIDWQLVRDIPINGKISFATLLERDLNDQLALRMKINPGQINFGNALWEIMPATVFYGHKALMVSNFQLLAPTQAISISGSATDKEGDVLTVQLTNVELSEIFETLEINNALIGGQATGTVEVQQLFTPTPSVASTSFKVKDIGYNYCTFGDADLSVGLDAETKAILFEADIAQPDRRHSSLSGKIVPATQELELQIDADHVKVDFLQPFMSAFCSQINGYASGKARLFGTFSNLDLSAQDLVADSLRMKIDFTNTWYHVAKAPISINPGRIAFDDITLYDDYGKSARLSGFLSHDFFHNPIFKFEVSDARDLLCYDMPQTPGERWWGTVFGNGNVTIEGRPGVVNIDINVSTCAHSKFTFALLDSQVAEEYSFITFRDVTPHAPAKQFYEIKVETAALDRARGMQEKVEESPSAYNIEITVDITPDALVTLVMDPVSGDEIRAYGSGRMNLVYASLQDDISLWGTYELERGTYNFSLQDIILREFKIRSGSTIAFDGDPYKATLKIEAAFRTNANLSDLDESFLNDKELNSTNVPVEAVMYVTGLMTQPDIKFDIEIPNFSDDVNQKVKSIVSTEEMMNRQIIYLLALNRFYTPEYMSTTKSNELFSVASSTIASQLSSMLGKLSDNWSIAPNLRSDRGDFSDVEVDVNLSSRLLNNRLLFNGNFGYRDKSLNTNQFIGDFDVEYLINPKGTFRLKAYNRYNDQNYYLRTAQTTQGIGFIIRRDFDDWRDLFRKKKTTTLNDSIK